ncbi:MAG TPA: FlgD immunoglobulin-like domain containing protein, partial [Candidatus Eisenbacteria bacterium]
GDNRADAGDLVRLADIVLGRGEPPTSEELELADCNGDDALDIRDMICLSDVIVPSGSAPPPAGNGSLATLQFALEVPVRAIELDFPVGTALEDAADALAPLAVTTWVQANGAVALMAWDPAGRPLPAGSFDAVPASRAPLDARAWGDGGKALSVHRDGRSVSIGAAIEAPPVPVVSAAPTPFNDATTIRWRVSRPGVTTVQIFDVRGALRRSWTSSELAAGDHAWTWDGRDEAGERLASGVYFARVGIPDGRRTLRLVRVVR